MLARMVREEVSMLEMWRAGCILGEEGTSSGCRILEHLWQRGLGRGIQGLEAEWHVEGISGGEVFIAVRG